MKRKPLGIIIGSILAAAAVVSIFFVKLDPEPEEPPPLVRPIKSIVAGGSTGPIIKKYPGKVDAADSVNLSFLVAGTLTDKMNIKKGDRVTEGQELAKLDPRDFQSALDGAQAKVAQAKAEYNRVQRLFVSKNASKADLEAAEAASKIAASELERAHKALEDTVLKAEFAGIIADSFPDRGENVSAGQAIYRLQSADSRMKIEIQVPESHIARAGGPDSAEKWTATASFDFLPDEQGGIPLQMKDFVSVADPATQTYAVSFWLEAPDGVNILPGMSAMVTVKVDPDETASDTILAPLAAVPADPVGQYFVWKLSPGDGDQFSVARTDVSVGIIRDDQIEITSGLEKGDRIAAAGTHVLTEGQVVRLLDSSSLPE